MAENIQKVYPGGAWYNDTEKKRYSRVLRIMDGLRSEEYDDQDVRWFLKNAIINHVYFSELVFQNRYNSEKGYWKNPNNEALNSIIYEIENNGYASHRALCIRKHFGKGLIFEHAVPFNLVMKRLVALYDNNELSFERFQQVKSKLNVCIITIDEDQELNKRHLRIRFPEGVDWENGNEFARYDDAGIVIHGR